MWKQGRDAYPKIKDVHIPSNVEEYRKEVVKSFYRAVLPGLCLPLANYLASFSNLTCARILSNTCAQLSSSIDFNVKLSRRSMTYYGLASPYFWTLRSISAHLWCLLCPQNGKYMASWSFAQTRFKPFLFLHNCYHKVSTGDRAWLFTLFQLLLPFQRASRRLVVNI